MSKSLENFYGLFEPNWWHAEKQDYKCSENDSFVVSFIHLELRREREKDYINVGETKVGFGLQDS